MAPSKFPTFWQTAAALSRGNVPAVHLLAALISSCFVYCGEQDE